MFLPLLNKYKSSGAAGLIGRVVKVYTSDSRVSYYRIISARKTTNSMSGLYSLAAERLRLQTSTGPSGKYPKLIADAVRYETDRRRRTPPRTRPRIRSAAETDRVADRDRVGPGLGHGLVVPGVRCMSEIGRPAGSSERIATPWQPAARPVCGDILSRRWCPSRA